MNCAPLLFGLAGLLQDTMTMAVDSLGVGGEYALEGFALALGAAFGALGVLAQELVKKGLKVIRVWDSWIGAVLKPLQPMLAAALGLLLAFVWGKLPFTTDAPPVDLLLSAPIGTVIGVALREVALRLKAPAA